jgi:hypothetical protein
MLASDDGESPVPASGSGTGQAFSRPSRAHKEDDGRAKAVHARYLNHAPSLCAAAWRWSSVYISLVRDGKGPGKQARQ